MKVSELYDHVSRLGFESSLEDARLFYNTANRAILQVNALRPAIRTCEINHSPLPNLIEEDTFSGILLQDSLVFEAEAPRAYYFEADGDGHFFLEKLEEGVWRIIHESSLSSQGAKYRPYSGFVKDGDENVDGTVRVRFESEYACSVRNVALYGAVRSDSEADVHPFAPFARYRMPDICDDFLSFAEPPVKTDLGYDKMIQGYKIEGNETIIFPKDAVGVYLVLYNHKPNALSYESNPTEDDTVIDLAEDLCALLPVLVASYAWLDDEEGKAVHYMNIYREMAANIERKGKSVASSDMRDVYGWM